MTWQDHLGSVAQEHQDRVKADRLECDSCSDAPTSSEPDPTPSAFCDNVTVAEQWRRDEQRGLRGLHR